MTTGLTGKLACSFISFCDKIISMKKINLIKTLAAVLISSALYSADYTALNSYPKTSSVSGANVFCVNGSEGINDNPASAAYAPSVSGMNFVTGMGISVQNISCNFSSGQTNFGLSLSNYSFGQEQEISQDNFGAPVLTGKSVLLSSFGITGVYARKFGKLSAGFSLGALNEIFGTDFLAFNAGLGFRIDDIAIKGLCAGVSASGIDLSGRGLRIAGISALYSSGDDTPFFISSSFTFDGYAPCISLGAVVNLAQNFYLSAGTKYVSGMFYSAAGASFNIGSLGLNYSFEPMNITGLSNRISLTYNFESFGETLKQTGPDPQGEKSFAAYMRNGDYYYSGRQYSQAAKYYEHINVLYWKELQKMNANERSRFFQKLGICYYNIKDNARARQYFEQAVFLTPDNEILKHWLKVLK